MKGFTRDWWRRNKKRGTVVVCAAVALVAYLAYAYAYEVLPGAAFYLLGDLEPPAAQDRVLVFAPHPDDETIGAGAYIFTAAGAGAQVRIVLATDGNKHGLKDQRYREFRHAAALLGVPANGLEFWEYPDGRLEDYRGVLGARVGRAIAEFRPTVVFYPHPGDRHPDHAVLGRAVEELLAGSPGVRGYRYLVHHPHFPQPKMLARKNFLLPPVAMLTFDQRWLRFCPPREAEKAKAAAVLEYRTQLKNPFLRPLLLSFLRENELFSSVFEGRKHGGP
ncbi:MAG: PIG-L family deacetylase [Firmicutes bacterium]|nr:PIG-L family deacetylase [Bacillota bacterium]